LISLFNLYTLILIIIRDNSIYNLILITETNDLLKDTIYFNNNNNEGDLLRKSSSDNINIKITLGEILEDGILINPTR
jgi:hypothetical protein